MAFDEVRLSENYSSSSDGGPSWNDMVVTMMSGWEQRNTDQSRPRRDWQLQYEGYDEVLALYNFYRLRRGRIRAFRFRDWNDYKIDPSTPVEAAELTATTFQIRRVYADSLTSEYEDVVKPVSGTVVVYEDDAGANVVDPGDYTVDYTTGIITFDSDPDFDPFVSCEYDIPARFDSVKLPVQSQDVMREAVVRVVEVFDAS